MVLSKRRAAIVAAGLVMMLSVACSGGDDDGDSGDAAGSNMDMDEPVAEGAGYMSDSEGLSGGDGGGGSAPRERSALTLPNAEPYVIKTARLNLEVERNEIRDSIQAVVDAAERFGGFVVSTDIGSDETRKGSLTIRVPSLRFETALGDLRSMGEVKGESISGEDVSQEFVDLNARLRNLEAQEAVLLGLMEKATTISESIRVQNELQRIQGDIERHRGRIEYLEDQTSYSTISVALREAGAAAPSPKGAIGKAWEQAKEVSVAVISGVIVGTGFLLPIAFLMALLALVFRFVRPRLKLEEPAG